MRCHRRLQGDIHSVGDALGSLGTGALSGLTGGVGGAVAGKVGALVAGKVGSGVLGRLATDAVENGVDDLINQSVTTRRVDARSALLGMVPGFGVLDRKAGSSAGRAGRGLIDLGPVRAGAACARHSFAPDTKVLMADGSRRPIRDVNVGDRVQATDARTGRSSAQPVTQLHLNTDHDLTRVTVRDRNGHRSVLNTTRHHPFWDATDRKWSDAADLQPGHRLRVAGTGQATVTAVVSRTGTRDMRDLTVNDLHTYYVLAGTTPVLVHNCDLTEAVHAEYARITTPGSSDYLSINKRGPVLTGVKDEVTGDIVTSLNHGTAIDNLHPSLAARLGPNVGSLYPGGSGIHGEVHGLDELLWGRESAGLSTQIDDSLVSIVSGCEGRNKECQPRRVPPALGSLPSCR